MRSSVWAPIQCDGCPYKKGSGDISRACAQRKDHERTRRQPSQAHTRGLGRKQTCDVALQAPRTVAKVTVCGTLLWQPEQTNSSSGRVIYLRSHFQSSFYRAILSSAPVGALYTEKHHRETKRNRRAPAGLLAVPAALHIPSLTEMPARKQEADTCLRHY